MPDTDDYGGFMLMTNVRTRSHRGLLGSLGVTFSHRPQRGDGGRRKHTRYFCWRSSLGLWGIWVKCFAPSLSPPHSAPIWPDGRGQSPGKNGRSLRKRRQVTRNHNVFCFFHPNRLSHHLGPNKSAIALAERERCAVRGPLTKVVRWPHCPSLPFCAE